LPPPLLLLLLLLLQDVFGYEEMFKVQAAACPPAMEVRHYILTYCCGNIAVMITATASTAAAAAHQPVAVAELARWLLALSCMGQRWLSLLGPSGE
jgi:hypothetical protein